MKTMTLTVNEMRFLAENGIAYQVVDGTREAFTGGHFEAVENAAGLFVVSNLKAKADPAWGLSSRDAAVFCTERVGTVATRREAMLRASEP